MDIRDETAPVGDEMALPQGDPRLLHTDVAQRLLASSVPARYAYTSRDGTPRIVSSWFDWTGDEIVMPTFVSAPHVRHPVTRLRDLRAHPDIAITIDTDAAAPEVLLIRGRATITEVDGVVPEHTRAARRYLDADAAAYLAQIDHPTTKMARIAVRPAWVGVLDFHNRLPSARGGVTG